MRKLGSISRRKFGILMGAKLCLLASKSHGKSPPSQHVVTIHRFKFSPSELEITAGDTVVWENRDSAPHTATAQDEDWDTGEITTSQPIEVTFDQSGTFGYFCRYHPHMKALLTVPESAVAVVGLHTVFEHHAAMTPVSLAAFLLEYNITFPVGADMAGSTDIPLMMKAYKMRGTPSMVVIDQKGMICAHHYGSVSELQIGAEIATLLCQAQGDNLAKLQPTETSGRCDDSGCGV